MKTITLSDAEIAIIRWLCLKYAAKDGAVATPDMPVTQRIGVALVVAGRLS